MAHGMVGQDMVWERLSDASQGYSEDLEDDEAFPMDETLDATVRVAPGEEFEAADQEVQESCSVLQQPEDLTMWTEHTHSQLSLAESLRRDASQVLCEPLQRAPMSARSSATTLSSKIVQEQLRRNIAKAEKLQRVLHSRIEATREAIEKVSQHIFHLLAAHNEKEAPLQVAEQRLELRAQRPPSEMIQDHLQEALESEKMVLSKAREKLGRHIEAGQEVLKSLEQVKAEMISEMQHKHQLLRLDRSSLLFDGFHSDEGRLPRKARALRSSLRERGITTIRQLLGTMRELQELSSRFCKESDSLLAQTRRDANQAYLHTRSCLRKRINETSELKKRLEKELVETGGTIASMEQSLAIMKKQLSSKGKWNKKDTHALWLSDESAGNLGHGNISEALYEKLVSVESLSGQLLERAEAAAGDGTSLSGIVQAEAMLATQSDTLDEALLRWEEALSQTHGEALRRLNQVGEKLHLHRETLDKELAHFASVKKDLQKVLQDRCERVESTLDSIRTAREKLSADLQNKTEALRIDVGCSNVVVTVAANTCNKGEDQPLYSHPRGIFQLPSPRPYRPPLLQETLETLKKRVRASAYTGGGPSGSELDVIFRRFDKDGSGQLDDREVRMALRRTLRVPPSMISDAQISTLCAMLDVDKSGSVSIEELVDFIGAGPVLSPRTGRPMKGPGVLLSPINTVDLSDTLHSPSSKEQDDKVRLPRPYRPPLQKGDLDALRSKIKAASYSGSGLGRQIGDIFLRFDKDGSGQLEDHEVRQALRRVLRIPASTISDAQISSLCALLDKDCSGAVSVNELVDFVGPEPEVSHRTGRRLQGALIHQSANEHSEAGVGKLLGGARLEPLVQPSDTGLTSGTEAGASELR